MKDYDKFYLVTALTTWIVRVAVWLNPVASPTVNGFRFHHWMYGLAGTLLCMLLAPFRKSIVALGVTIGVFIDESGYLAMGGKTHEDNYSPASFILLMLFEVMLFLFRKQIIKVYCRIGERSKVRGDS